MMTLGLTVSSAPLASGENDTANAAATHAFEKRFTWFLWTVLRGMQATRWCTHDGCQESIRHALHSKALSHVMLALISLGF